MIEVTSPLTLDLFLIGLSPSHDPGHEFIKLTQLIQFFFVFLIDFFPSISSLIKCLIKKLGFMIYFNLIFIRLS
jgi:hypothetical protein